MESELVICGVCWRLRGEVDPGTQLCSCDPPPRERWAHFDHNTAFELCYCCGAELLRSGSRWSVWFCKRCKEHVTAFNRSVGCYVIPIGRHSLMAGIALAGPAAHRSEAVEALTDEVVPFFDLVGATQRCSGAAVRTNLAEVGLLETADVTLTTYLDAIDALAMDRALRVHQLLDRITAS